MDRVKKQLELDKLDRKVLSYLSKDVRASYSQIAKAAKTSKEVVRYRIERLEEKRVILGYETILGFKYWAYKILIQSQGEEKTTLQTLTQRPRITWITPCSGHWDYVFSIMAQDPKDFQEQWEFLQNKLYLQKYSLATGTGSNHYGYSFLNQPQIQNSYKQKERVDFSIDDKDKAILLAIQSNARKKIIDIHKQTNIPVDTIVYRMKQLEKSGVIRRYRLLLDMHKLGFQSYEVFIRANTSTQFLQKFEHFCESDKRVSFFGRLVGNWNLELTIHLQDSRELRDFLIELKNQFGNEIKSIQTITLFETKKYSFTPDELL